MGIATFSAVSSGISAYQAGGNFLAAAGISIVSGVAGFYGASLGGAWGQGLAGSFGAAVLGGLVGGAASGAVRSALTGDNVVAGTFIGAGMGTAGGIIIGGLTYTAPAETQTGSNPNDSTASKASIRSGDIQGTTDIEVNSSNQSNIIARKTAADRLAKAAENGTVGTGNNPSSDRREVFGPHNGEVQSDIVGDIASVVILTVGAKGMAAAGAWFMGLGWIKKTALVAAAIELINRVAQFLPKNILKEAPDYPEPNGPAQYPPLGPPEPVYFR